jgi:hypothetical protein
MTHSTFQKFNKFVFYPDLSNKFLPISYYSVMAPKHFNVYLKYIFSSRTVYSSTALKALLMLSSIYPRRCQATSRLILIKFAKNQSVSSVFFKFNLNEIAQTLSLAKKKPIKPSIVTQGFIRQSPYFVFPGFIKRLRFPFWERYINMSFKQDSTKNLYFFLFYKTAFID